MSRRIRLIAVLLLTVILGTGPVLAYGHLGPEGGAHRLFNRLALEAFVAGAAAADPLWSRCDFTPDAAVYGMDPAASPLFTVAGPAVVSAGIFTKREKVLAYSFLGWLMEGGYSADAPGLRMSLRHFYDPLARNGATYITDRIDWPFNPRIDALDWAVELSPHSWRRGRNCLRQALQTADIEARSALFATAWRCLGEAMHIAADMTVPAHVRNDAHPSPMGDADPYEAVVDAGLIRTAMADGYADPVTTRLLAAAGRPEEVLAVTARYTNAHFFSDDTITGRDPLNGKRVRSRNREAEYDAPLLEDCSFDPATGFFSLTDFQGELIMAQRLPGGRIAVTGPCIHSQARRLIPVAVAADTRLIELYLPRVEIAVAPAGAERILAGRITFRLRDEDGGTWLPALPAFPGGRVAMLARIADRTVRFDTFLTADGGFSIDLSPALTGLQLPAATIIGLDCGGILVWSPAATIP